MAGKENLNKIEQFVVTFSKGEMVFGIGAFLVPGLGTIGATAFILGALKYAYLDNRRKEHHVS